MEKFYTYIHTKADDGSVFYVGKGYSDRAWVKENRNIYWHRTVAKHGYKVEIIAYWSDEKDAFTHERNLISTYKEIGCKLVNLTPGGEGSSGYRWTDEQKQRFDMTGEKNGMFGKKHSEETRQKIAAKAKGRKINDAAKAKISEAMKVRVFTESHRAALRKSSKGSLNGIGNKGNPKACLIEGVRYASTKQAAQALGLTPCCIQGRCKNKNYPEFNYI